MELCLKKIEKSKQFDFPHPPYLISINDGTQVINWETSLSMYLSIYLGNIFCTDVQYIVPPESLDYVFFLGYSVLTLSPMEPTLFAMNCGPLIF